MISKIIQSIKLYLHRKEKFYGLSISEWGFVPGNKGLYTLALLHKSASRYTKSGTVLNYERLEFLGDAVLGAIVAEILYKFFPNKDEGFMTRLRSNIVSRESLNIIAIKMGLSEEVIAKSDISKNKHIYGDVFEAFTGSSSGSRLLKLMVGGTMLFFTARTQAIASKAPAAPSKCPVIDLVELMFRS